MVRPAMIVFLDIDGILNSGQWRRRGRPGEHPEARGLDPVAVAMLEPLVAMGARFVLSSTWRCRFDGPGMTKVLSTLGFTGEVIDRTPLDPDVRTQSGLIVTTQTRGDQVSAWLAANLGCGRFVILDDEGDRGWWGGVYERVLLADFEVGLTPGLVARAIDLLLGRGGADPDAITAVDGKPWPRP
jgi:hypothetical protein